MLMDDKKEFAITYDRSKHYYVSAHKQGIMAWVELNANQYDLRIIKPSQIKDGENFLKSVGIWERYEKEYNAPKEVEINDNVEIIPKRTEPIIAKVKVPVVSKVVDKVPDVVHNVNVVKRGRPKGSKNIKKDK